MSLFGRNYDYDHGFRGNERPRPDLHGQGYGRGYRGGTGGWEYGFDRDRGGYGGDYRQGGYDRNYKSQWQTDHGDPFGDRQNRTPMRVIRGEYRARDDNRGWNSGYGRDYSRNPMSYDPYGGSHGNAGGGWGNRSGPEGWGAEGNRGGWNRDEYRGPRNPGLNRGYDRGWF